MERILTSLARKVALTDVQLRTKITGRRTKPVSLANPVEAIRGFADAPAAARFPISRLGGYLLDATIDP
jgi:hypothetical protein